MISLLRLLHAAAAKRGDGLHPELRKHLPNADANKADDPYPTSQAQGNLHHAIPAARLVGSSKKQSP